MSYVVGVDACKGGWIAVVLGNGSFVEACRYASARRLVDEHRDASVIAIDIPIGLPERGRRRADIEARRFVGPRRNSVFLTPPRELLEAATYGDALKRARYGGGPGISRQLYTLAPRILEVEVVASEDVRVIEIHPEVSFRAMAASPLPFSKRTWNGLMHRRRLLEAAGVCLPDHLPQSGEAPADDVLDAAAAAWSARRAAEGEARTIADPPERTESGTPVAIWY